MALDFLGKKVEIGDYVVYRSTTPINLGVGIVIRENRSGSVTIKKIASNTFGRLNKLVIRHPQDIFKISNEDIFLLKMES